MDRCERQSNSLVTKITGTVIGDGYDCHDGDLSSHDNITTDGQMKNNFGLWNNVAYHVPWIKERAKEESDQLKEDCRSGGEQVQYPCNPFLFR